MGDSVLSQDEIDSLLTSLDGGPAPAAPRRGGPAPAASPEAAAFKAVLDDAVDGFAGIMSTFITQSATTISPPVVDIVSRDVFLRDLPEEVLSINVSFGGSLPGEHIFILSRSLALSIASSGNGQPDMTDLDDMAINAVQECMGNLTGSLISALSQRTGNTKIEPGVPEGGFGPKAMARVPSGDMVRAVYQLKIGDAPPERIVEIFSLPFVRDVVASSGGAGGGSQSSPASFGAMGGGMGGGQMGGMQQQGGGQMGGMQQQNGYGMQQQGYPMGGGFPGGMQMGGGGMQYGGYAPR